MISDSKDVEIDGVQYTIEIKAGTMSVLRKRTFQNMSGVNLHDAIKDKGTDIPENIFEKEEDVLENIKLDADDLVRFMLNNEERKIPDIQLCVKASGKIQTKEFWNKQHVLLVEELFHEVQSLYSDLEKAIQEVEAKFTKKPEKKGDEKPFPEA